MGLHLSADADEEDTGSFLNPFHLLLSSFVPISFFIHPRLPCSVLPRVIYDFTVTRDCTV